MNTSKELQKSYRELCLEYYKSTRDKGKSILYLVKY
jgi:hypothetical protein